MAVHRAALVGVAGAVGLGSALLASGDRVPRWEVSVTRWFDRWPDAFATALWPVMQLGTFWAPIAAATLMVALARRGRHALATVAVGLGTWWGAQLLKHAFARPRPVCCLPDIDLRGAATGGYGFPSGHSATAAGLAVMVAAVMPRRWRWLPVTLAGLVGISRMVYGAHFPVDVLGGWALGAVLGGAMLLVSPARAISTQPAMVADR